MANLSLLLFNYAQGGRDGAGQSQWLRAKKKKKKIMDFFFSSSTRMIQSY